MPIKKVKRPILRPESTNEFHNNTKKTNMETLTNNGYLSGNQNIISNQFDSNSFFHNEEEKTTDNMEMFHEQIGDNDQNSQSILDQIICFQEENVRLPRRAKVEEGVYSFRINSISCRKVKGMYGNYDQLLFQFSLYKNGMEEPSNITIPYNYSQKENSPLMKFLRHFKSLFSGQSIKFCQLIGLQGQCKITHYQNNYGDVYEQLEILQVEQPS